MSDSQALRARRYRATHPARRLITLARNRAEGRFPCELTEAAVQSMLDYGVCAYCGVRLEAGKGAARPTSPTLDRLVPSEGYTDANTVLACHRCNALKGEANAAELRRLADRIDTLIFFRAPVGQTGRT